MLSNHDQCSKGLMYLEVPFSSLTSGDPLLHGFASFGLRESYFMWYSKVISDLQVDISMSFKEKGTCHLVPSVENNKFQ